MSQEFLAIVGVAAIALFASLTTIVRDRRGRAASDADPDPEAGVREIPRAGLLARFRDIVDRSIGAYLLRRLLRRPTDPLERPSFPALLTLQYVAHRIGNTSLSRDATPRPLDLAPAASAAPGRRIADPPLKGAPQARRRLIGDTGAALVGLAVIALLATAVRPPESDNDAPGLSATDGPTTGPPSIFDPASPSPTP